MRKQLIIYTVMMILFLTKVSVDNKQPYIPKVQFDYNLFKEYDIRSNLDKLEKEHKAYLKRQQKWNEIIEHNKQQEKQRQAELQQENELQTRSQQEVLLEVSFYHDGLKTASGAQPQVGRTIACPKEVPFGSIIKFEGKEYICEDRGGYIQKVWSDKYNDYLYRVDVYANSPEECKRLGRYVTTGIIEFK